jgi:hypothetical protein
MAIASSKDNHHHDHGHAHTDRAKQDDLLWTTRQVLQQRVMPTPKTAIGAVLDERFASLFDSLRERQRGDKQQEGAKLGGQGAESQDRAAASQDIGGLSAGTQAQGVEQPPTLLTSAVDSVPTFAPTDLPQFAVREDAPQFISPSQQPQSVEPNQDVLRAPSVAPPSWVWIASQALGANLKRLGFEPSELDDIRVSLIRVLAADFPKLKLLTKLPSSLSPAAPEKVIDDIRVMALAYMMNELLAKSVKDLEEQEEQEENQKQDLEIPRSVSNRYKDIPAIIYDPMDVAAT